MSPSDISSDWITSRTISRPTLTSQVHFPSFLSYSVNKLKFSLCYRHGRSPRLRKLLHWGILSEQLNAARSGLEEHGCVAWYSTPWWDETDVTTADRTARRYIADIRRLAVRGSCGGTRIYPMSRRVLVRNVHGASCSLYPS
jgi:hypothetical protein